MTHQEKLAQIQHLVNMFYDSPRYISASDIIGDIDQVLNYPINRENSITDIRFSEIRRINFENPLAKPKKINIL